MSRVKEKILATGSLSETICVEAYNNGFALDVVPFITIETSRDKDLRKEIISLSTASREVIFTSQHAVEAVIENLDGIRPGWNIYCLANITAGMVRKYFGQDRIKATAADAGSLAKCIEENIHDEELVFFCAYRRRDELPHYLKTKNIAVREIVVYNTISIDRTIQEEYDAILFFSPSAVDSFFKNNKINETTLLFAIGHTTGNSIKKYSANELVIADQHDKDELVRTATRYLAQKQMR